MLSPLKRLFKAKKPNNHPGVFGFFLCSALTMASGNALEPLYKAKGDSAVLDPNFSGQPITSIVWSQESGIVAEWYGDSITCLRQFKGRCSLDLSTGALNITGADERDNGLYSVEINNNKIDSKIQLFVISKVSKPSIKEECNTDITRCTLSCDGNSTEAELIRYKWFTGDNEIGSGKEYEISKDTKEESFTCMMLNPVSEQSSESFKNPIITEGKRNRMITITIIVIALVVFAVIISLIAFFIRKKKGDSYNPQRASRETEQGTPGEITELLPNGGTGQNQVNENNLEEVRVELNQISARAVTQDNVGELGLEAQRVTAQAQVSNDGNSEEAGPTDQNPGGSESPGTIQENGSTSITCETPVEDPPEPVNNNDAVENSAVSSNNYESTKHKPTEHEPNNHESNNHEPNNHKPNNHEPTLTEEEANGGGDGDKS